MLDAPSTQPSSAANPATTIQLPNYEILDHLGEGGFSQVYKARQLNTGQTVAIKLLKLGQQDPARKERQIARFDREAQLCARLHHTNIVRVLDKGQTPQGDVFAVFEYIPGLTLKGLLDQKGGLPATETAALMGQVLDALACAHALGIVHRDLKPQNIMVTTTGASQQIKLLDFGIGAFTPEARQLDYKSLTMTKETIGTPTYSAPEQLRGEPPTCKTDLYAWGLIFLECLTNTPAVRGSSLAAVFAKQLSPSNVPLPAAVVGHPVSELLRRVLNKNAHERAGDAAEVYRSLKSLNFSTLVGDLQPTPAQTIGHNTQTGDATQVDTLPMYTTGNTQCKQITALCLSLEIDAQSQTTQDPEIIDAFYRDQKAQCADIAIRYGGFLAGEVGDTQLFYFGYPVASDNDSRLCARTALDLVSLIHKRNSLLKKTQGIQSHIRLGIHSGLVHIYDDATPEGLTPNTAMQLAREASRNQILCSDNSRRRLENHIEFEPQPIKEITLLDQCGQIFSLQAERQVEAIGFLRGTRSNNCFIGREAELQQLLAFSNLTGDAQFAHVYGEAGIGKSRLIYEYRNHLKALDQYTAQCLPEYQYNALYPILKVIRYQYSLYSHANDATFEQLQKILNLHNTDKINDSLAILYAWLGLELPSHIDETSLAQDTQKGLLFNTLAVLLSHAGENNNQSLYIFEDMHWSDPTTIEFIDYLTSHNAFIAQQHLFVSTSRVALPTKLANLPAQTIKLERLSDEQTLEFLAALFDHHTLAEEVSRTIIERTDGIPLFIEELTNTLRQKALVHTVNHTVKFTSADSLKAIPNNLQESLQQKLDNLIYAKETAQLAASIGREFNYALLASASNFDEERLQIDLNELVESGLVYVQRNVDGNCYIFKHALVKDAAYDSTPLSYRKAIHLRIAESMISSANIENQEPLIIAQHFSGAEDFHSAALHGITAITRSSKNCAYLESQKIGDDVEKWIAMIPAENRQLLTINLNTKLIPAKRMIEGWGANSIKHSTEQSLALINTLRKQGSDTASSTLDEAEHICELALLLYHHYQGNREKAREFGENLLAKILQSGDRVKEVMTLSILGQAYFFEGEFAKAKPVLMRVIALYDAEKDTHLHEETGFDPFNFATGNLMCIEAITGNHTHARQLYTRCIEHAQQTENISIIIVAYTFGTCLFLILNDLKAMSQCTNEVINTYGDSIKSNWIYRNFYMMHDWTRNEYKQSEITVAEDVASGQDSFLSWYVPALADTYINHGFYDKAVTLMEDSEKRSVQSGENCILPITYRYLAKAHFKKSEKSTTLSERYFSIAIEKAKESDSKWLEFLASLEFIKCKPSQELSTALATRMRDLIKDMPGTKENHWVCEFESINLSINED